MTVKNLKEIIQNMPDNREVLLVGYEHRTGRSTKQCTNQCCNTEHQEKINQLWLSKEGICYAKKKNDRSVNMGR